jgi:PAS domain S-box-containing protein
MFNDNYLRLKNNSNVLKIILVLFAFLLYSYLFFLLFSQTDQRISALSLLPVIAASFFFGMRVGIITSLISILANTLYFHWLNLPALTIMIQNVPGALGSIGIAAALGYLHDIQEKFKNQLKISRQEIHERKKAEEKLFTIQMAFQPRLPNREMISKLSLNNIGSLNTFHKMYKEIAENAADIIYTVNLDGYFTYVNKIGLNSINISLEEFLKLKFSDLAAPGYKDIVKRFYLKQFLKKELNSYLEFPFKIREGSIRWFGQNGTLIFENEKITGFSFIARDITDRKKIENELKESEAVLRSITYMANDAIVSVDSDFNIIQWNRAAELMYGYSENEIIGKSIKEIMPPHKRNSFENIISMENPMNGIDPTNIMERLGYHKNGTSFPVEISIAEWEKNSAKFYTHIIRDITGRKEIEDKIKQSEKDYRLLFENAHEPILLIKPEDEKILEANEQACKIYGFDHSELVGTSLKNISKNVERGKEKIIETLEKEQFINFETIQYNKAGNEIYFEIYASTTEYKGEKVIISLNRDITSRVLAERKLEEYKNHLEELIEERTEKLKEANEKLSIEIQKLTDAESKILNQVEYFKTLVNTIPIPVFVKDRKNFYPICNKAFYDFFGTDNLESIGKNNLNFDSLSERKMLTDNTFETTVVDKENKIHEVIIHHANLLGKENTNEGYVGIILDISQQKKMQIEITKAFEAEKELGELKSRFVSTASHEFRTPLTSILASCELLQRYNEKWTSEKKLDTLKRIEKSVLYMNEMVNDVLTLSRAETGKLGFNPVKTNLINISKNILEEVRLIASTTHEFITDFDDKCGEVFVDEKLIRNIIGNLLTNAVKYSPKGGKIYFKLSQNCTTLKITVADEGLGISEEDQKKLFQPFFRGSNIETIPGTGLGLSIMQRGITLHKGTFSFKSKLNEGTTFNINIPLEKPE